MSRTPALVEHVAELRRHLGSRRTVQRPVLIDGAALSSAAVPAGAEVEVDLVLESIFEGVVVSGTVTIPWEGACRRCLEDVHGTLTVDVREVFEPKPVEGETWPLVNDDIDLGPVVHDAVLLGLPIAPLCREDCAGPAPEAYPALVEADEDEEPAPPRDPRWAALDGLDLSS